MKQQRIQCNRYKQVWSIGSWVMSKGLRVMGLLSKATTFRFSSSCLKSSQVGGVPNVGGVTRQHAKGDISECCQWFLW